MNDDNVFLDTICVLFMDAMEGRGVCPCVFTGYSHACIMVKHAVTIVPVALFKYSFTGLGGIEENSEQLWFLSTH